MDGDELQFIEWLGSRCKPREPVLLGIGDDMAIVAVTGGQMLLSSDLLLDGVHFDLQHHPAKAIGRKAIARCLSDCAAMAVRPVCVLASLALPREMALEAAEELMVGLQETAEAFDTAVAGGDTARWNGPLAIDVAVWAECFPDQPPVRRSGAKEGDILYVSGALGGSLLGRHMTFCPRVHEARAISRQLGPALHAMIDVSDGLSLDLWRMCQASGVGGRIDESLLATALHGDAQRAASQDGKSAVEHALSDGEDHELLMSIESAAQVDGLGLLPVGVVVKSGLWIQHRDGGEEPLQPQGYVH